MKEVEVDWGIADKIYARAEEKIRAETTKEEQKIAQDCTKRRVNGTTMWLSAIHKARMDMLAQLAEARIDADWEIVSQSKENITDLEIAKIISRLSDVLTRHISSLMQSIAISANRNRIGGSALFSSFEFKNNRTKAELFAKAKRELEIRKDLLGMKKEFPMTKITVLFLAANPKTHTQLALDEEIREITEKIRLSNTPTQNTPRLNLGSYDGPIRLPIL